MIKTIIVYWEGLRVGRCAVLAVLALVSAISGCAEKGPILLSLSYQPPAAIKTALSPSTPVVVTTFVDNRGVPGSLIGRRIVSNGMNNDFLIRGSAADLITSALKQALQARGAVVKTGGAWNLAETAMPTDGSGIAVGGEIKAFWIDSVSVPFKTTMKADVRITVVAGDIASRKIIRTLNVDSKAEQEVLYSEEKLNSILSEAISAALDQIFQDDVIRQRLQERR